MPNKLEFDYHPLTPDEYPEHIREAAAENMRRNEWKWQRALRDAAPQREAAGKRIAEAKENANRVFAGLPPLPREKPASQGENSGAS